MQNSPLTLSIIIPLHNEATNLVWHHQVISEHLAKLGESYEIIYVDDGSTDNSLSIVKDIASKDSQVRYLSFSRNFGKEAATSAGLKFARGRIAIMMDADGQHPISVIDKFLDQWRNGYQVVIGVRKANTREGFVKRYGSKLFYRLLNSVSQGKTIPRSTDFRLVDRRVIDEFNQLTEHNRITRGLIDWLGFRRTTVEFVSPARHSGNATYGFSKLVRLAMHAFVSQTTRPLQFGGILGAIVTLLSSLAAIFLIVEKYVFGDALNLAVTGTGLLGLFVSLLVGLVLISQWLLALYIESIHNETQNRPLYIVDEQSS